MAVPLLLELFRPQCVLEQELCFQSPVQIAQPTDAGLTSEVADGAVTQPSGFSDLIVEFRYRPARA